MNHTDFNGNRDLIQENVIQAATKGDIEAIESVLGYYERYICSLTTRPFYDEYGTVLRVVDQEMKGRIQTQLIKYILRFEIAS